MRSRGLNGHDIENLRQRGYTPEQLRNFRYPDASILDSNTRANLIASRLNNRVDFTREATANQPVYHAPFDVADYGIYDVRPGQPITRDEIMGAIRNRILPEDFDFSLLEQATPESINSYYTSIPSIARSYTIRPLDYGQ